MDMKEFFKNMANPYIEHEDVNKCGLCLKEKIKSEVAKEFLDAGKLSQENLSEMFDEVDRRWQQTELFKRVRSLMEAGLTLDEVSAKLAAEGIDI